MHMDVIIARNKSEIKDVLDSYTNLDFLYIGERKADLTSLLASGGAREISLEPVQDEQFKSEYVKNYVDLIGTLGKRYNSLTWWATFVASKNKFISQLLPNIFLLVSILRLLKQRENLNLLIISPPEEILPSLEQYCCEHSIGFINKTSLLTSILQTINNVIYRVVNPVRFILRIWIKIIVSKWYFSSRVREKIKPDFGFYVLRSWFYERSITEKGYNDSFFGTLPDFLSSHKNVLVLAGIIGNYRVISKKIAHEPDHLIIPEEFFLSVLDPVRALVDVRKNRIVLSERVLCFGFDITGIVEQELMKEFSFYIPQQYIYSSIITGLVRATTIDTFTTTYENNPWEKVCFLTLRNTSPGTKIIGYQHAALSKSSLNMVLSDVEKEVIPLPDRIVTVGDVTREFLTHQGNFNPERVTSGCGLRFAHLFSLTVKERSRHNSILVTPEGVLTESVNLSNFAYNALHNNTALRLVIRPHPALPYQIFKTFLNFKEGDSNNISISKNDSVSADLEVTDAVIYRGSTLALEAMKMGMPVFYVDQSDLISVDPLFDFSGLNWIVHSEKELVDSIRRMYAMDPREYDEKLRRSHEFLKRYIVEISEERLQEFLI
jgi:hypothetical protein